MQQIMKSCAYHREGIDPWMHPKSRILSRYQGIRKVGANTLEGNPSGSSPVFRANLCQQFPMAIENPHGRVESMVRAKLHGKRRKNDITASISQGPTTKSAMVRIAHGRRNPAQAMRTRRRCRCQKPDACDMVHQRRGACRLFPRLWRYPPKMAISRRFLAMDVPRVFILFSLVFNVRWL